MNIHNNEKVTRWTADAVQSEISFVAQHLMVSRVKGDFAHFEANVLTNGTDFSTADISLKIFSKSLNTDDPKLDAMLKGSNFLSVDEHRQIIFTSTSVLQTSNGSMVLYGDLKVCGKSKNIRLDIRMGAAAKDAWGDETACVLITGKLTRDDWGLKWTAVMEEAGFLVGDELEISCKLELYSTGQHDARKMPDIVAQARTIVL